jgi:hypothetical protein
MRLAWTCWSWSVWGTLVLLASRCRPHPPPCVNVQPRRHHHEIPFETKPSRVAVKADSLRLTLPLAADAAAVDTVAAAALVSNTTYVRSRESARRCWKQLHCFFSGGSGSSFFFRAVGGGGRPTMAEIFIGAGSTEQYFVTGIDFLTATFFRPKIRSTGAGMA